MHTSIPIGFILMFILGALVATGAFIIWVLHVTHPMYEHIAKWRWPRMRLHTTIVLVGCLMAAAAVAATDSYFRIKPDHTWVCRTDIECAQEDIAKDRNQRCLIINDTMVCLPIDRR